MRRCLPVLVLLLCASPACAQVPDFQLRDVSLNSTRRDAVISPRDYIMQVSGYYFGAAT